MKKNLPLIAVAAIIIVGALAFFGGMKYGETKVPAGNRFGNQAFNGSGAAGGASSGAARGALRTRNGGLTTGEITNLQGNNFTLKLSDGSVKTISLTSVTVISKLATTTTADLSVGESVSVVDTTGADGSLSAQSVQIRPAGVQTPIGGGQAPAPQNY